jgi:non-ribosomal peptide synthetase component E (peptide arylation enzyme)
MSAPGKTRLIEDLRKVVLPQQVPDSEVLTDSSAFQRFGLSRGSLSFLPDIVAFSKHHNTLFFIHADPSLAIDNQRVQELQHWSSAATCHVAIVAAFASRRAYAASTVELAASTYIWFADEPKHFLFISASPQASAEFLSARFAAK